MKSPLISETIKISIDEIMFLSLPEMSKLIIEGKNCFKLVCKMICIVLTIPIITLTLFKITIQF